MRSGEGLAEGEGSYFASKELLFFNCYRVGVMVMLLL